MKKIIFFGNIDDILSNLFTHNDIILLPPQKSQLKSCDIIVHGGLSTKKVIKLIAAAEKMKIPLFVLPQDEHVSGLVKRIAGEKNCFDNYFDLINAIISK